LVGAVGERGHVSGGHGGQSMRSRLRKGGKGRSCRGQQGRGAHISGGQGRAKQQLQEAVGRDSTCFMGPWEVRCQVRASSTISLLFFVEEEQSGASSSLSSSRSVVPIARPSKQEGTPAWVPSGGLDGAFEQMLDRMAEADVERRQGNTHTTLA